MVNNWKRAPLGGSMALLYTHAVMAQKYQNVIVKIISNPAQSFTVMGQSFTFHDVEKLERLVTYHNSKATASAHGRRSAPDLRRG